MNVLTCDIGGTRTKLGIVSGGRVLEQSILPSNSKQGLARLLPVIKAEWLRQLETHGLRLNDCKGVGISFPSLIDYKSGRILDSYGKFDDAMDIDLRAWSRAELRLPLVIENDARMACIGEWQYGVGRGSENLVMVTLGTGLGAAVIMEGRVLRGVHGQAGVLGGHMTVRYGGRACTCGNVGCAEAEASSFSLLDLATAHPGFLNSPLSNESQIDFASVFRHAVAGDPCAMALRDHNLLVWSSLAVSLIHAYDPELLIFGGGIMASADVILPAIREYVGRHAHTPWGQVRIEASALGDLSALVAAEWLLDEQSIHL
ncbi:MAG: ROK family protein [Verrucomicrobiota bacterium]